MLEWRQALCGFPSHQNLQGQKSVFNDAAAETSAKKNHMARVLFIPIVSFVFADIRRGTVSSGMNLITARI